MEAITISGKLMKDCEIRTDNKGNSFLYFQVLCTGSEYRGKARETIYRCFLYNMQYSTLKANDIVFLTGIFSVKFISGSPFFDVYVQQITTAQTK